MYKETINTANSLRFRRWSRKGYAMFVSLTCAVSIGVLAVSVCEKAEMKAASFGNIISNAVFATDLEDECTINKELLTSVENAISTLTISADAAACGCAKDIVTKNYFNI